MRLLLHVALRSLRKTPGVTLLAVLSVAAGIAFQVPNTANFRGYTAELVRVGVGRRGMGHVRVRPSNGDTLPDANGALARIGALPFVRGAFARLHYAAVIVRPEQSPHPLRIVGVDPAIETRVSAFCAHVASGGCLTTGGDDVEILLGALLAKQLGAASGDRLKLVLPVSDLGEVDMRVHRFRVAGIMQGTGGFEVDYDAYVDRSQLGRLLDVGDEATELAVFVDDRDRAAEHAKAIAAEVVGSTAVAWSDASLFVARAVAASEMLLGVSAAMVVVAVAVPVLALFAISVLRERRQIGVLAAVGFGPASIFALYVLRASLVGIAGVVAGLGLSFALLRWFARHPVFDHDGFAVRPIVDGQALLQPIAVVLGATLIASLVPALVAARTDPATTLRED